MSDYEDVRAELSRQYEARMFAEMTSDIDPIDIGQLTIECALEALENAINAVRDVELDELSTERLNDYLKSRAQLSRQLEASEADLLSHADECRAHKADAAPSAKKWLEYQAGYGPKEAGRKLCVARQLRAMPLTREAFAAGEISSEVVLKLSSVNVGRMAEAFARDEWKLLNWAKNLPYTRFKKKLDYWHKITDPDGPDQRTDKRKGRINRRDDDMFTVEVLLDHIVGSEVQTAVNAEVDRLFRQDWEAAKERLGKVPANEDLHRTHQQRVADAIANLIKRGAASTQQRRPLLNILIGSSALADVCELFNGTILTPAEVAEMLRQGITGGIDTQRIVFNDFTNDLAAEKPQRFFRGLTRRVAEIRDRTCQGAMCDHPADRCDIDHVVPWPAGPTSVHNAQCLCRSCHAHKSAADQRHKKRQELKQRRNGMPPARRPQLVMRN